MISNNEQPTSTAAKSIESELNNQKSSPVIPIEIPKSNDKPVEPSNESIKLKNKTVTPVTVNDKPVNEITKNEPKIIDEKSSTVNDKNDKKSIEKTSENIIKSTNEPVKCKPLKIETSNSVTTSIITTPTNTTTTTTSSTDAKSPSNTINKSTLTTSTPSTVTPTAEKTKTLEKYSKTVKITKQSSIDGEKLKKPKSKPSIDKSQNESIDLDKKPNTINDKTNDFDLNNNNNNNDKTESKKRDEKSNEQLVLHETRTKAMDSN